MKLYPYLESEDIDEALAYAAWRVMVPFVLSNVFYFNRLEKSSDSCILHPVNVSLAHQAGTETKLTKVFQSKGILCNLPVLLKQVTASGLCNFSFDHEGVLRRLLS